MKLKALPHYFIIKINIKKQQERKEKIGSLYTHLSHVFMERNMQSGEVVSIGEIANKIFPQVEIGSQLLVHHFVEQQHLIYDDNTYRYYTVTATGYNGRRNEPYGVFIDGKIIPHPEFIFIATEEKEKEISSDKFVEQKTKQIGSLILFENWEESRESKENKAKVLMEEIKQSSKGKELRDDVKIALEEKQNEASNITASLNKKQYIPLRIAFANPSLKVKEKVYCLNIGSQLILEFEGKEYIIVETKYVALTA